MPECFLTHQKHGTAHLGIDSRQRALGGADPVEREILGMSKRCEEAEVAKAGKGKSVKEKMEALRKQRVAFETRMKKMSEVIARRIQKQRKQVHLWTGAFCLEEATQNGTLESLKAKVAESRRLGAEKRLVMAWVAEGGQGECCDENVSTP